MPIAIITLHSLETTSTVKKRVCVCMLAKCDVCTAPCPLVCAVWPVHPELLLKFLGKFRKHYAQKPRSPKLQNTSFGFGIWRRRRHAIALAQGGGQTVVVIFDNFTRKQALRLTPTPTTRTVPVRERKKRGARSEKGIDNGEGRSNDARHQMRQ